MKFLIHSTFGESGIAMRLMEEGNQVQMFIKDPDCRVSGEGLVEHVSSMPEGLRSKPDCIVFDMVGSGLEADRLRRSGLNVIGGGQLQDRLEYDRKFGMDLARRLGIKMPEYKQFSKAQVDEAMDYVAETKGRYVLKPDDNEGGTALTYVSRSPDDMIQFLEWASKTHTLKTDFILQKFVPGIELSTEVWFSNGVPVSPPNGTIELKKLMCGDVGPNTGCMSSVVWGYPSREPRIVQQTVKKMYPALQAARYTGPLDVNAIVSEEDGKAYFLEFTPRFGYSAIYAFAEILKEDLGKMLHRVASGGSGDVKLRDGFGVAVRIAIPPYPLDFSDENKKAFVKTAGRRVRKLPEKHVWLGDVRMQEGNLVTAGTCGEVAEITYVGTDLQRTADKIYEMIKHIELPDMMYRTDGVKRAMEQLPKLRALGYEVPNPGGPDATQPRTDGKSQADNDKPVGKTVPVGSKTPPDRPQPVLV